MWVATLVALVVVLVLISDDEEEARPAQVRTAAFRWVGVGAAEDPRRDGDEWEVDVERPNGSLVEVTMDDELQLAGIDEELGPDGTRAADELTGPRRRRAKDTALDAVAPGRVFSVERESPGSVEVKIRRPDGIVEVQLESGRIIEVETAHPGDE